MMREYMKCCVKSVPSLHYLTWNSMLFCGKL